MQAKALLLQTLAATLPAGEPLREVFTKLSPRQIQVLLSLCSDDVKQEVLAARLNMKPKTFDAHRCELYKRLGVHSDRGAVMWAMRAGLLSAETGLMLNPFDETPCVPAADPQS